MFSYDYIFTIPFWWSNHRASYRILTNEHTVGDPDEGCMQLKLFLKEKFNL